MAFRERGGDVLFGGGGADGGEDGLALWHENGASAIGVGVEQLSEAPGAGRVGARDSVERARALGDEAALDDVRQVGGVLVPRRDPAVAYEHALELCRERVGAQDGVGDVRQPLAREAACVTVSVCDRRSAHAGGAD